MAAFLVAHVVAPRLGDAGDQVQAGIDLPGRLEDAIGQAEQFFFRSATERSQQLLPAVSCQRRMRPR